MNSETNKRLVFAFGDETQLNVGTESGSYAKTISKDCIREFCENLNEDPDFKTNGYYFTAKYNYKNEKSCITLKHLGKKLIVPIKLLDHSIYVAATEEDWLKIDDTIFDLILKNWRRFLMGRIEEYQDHFHSTLVLSGMNTNSI